MVVFGRTTYSQAFLKFENVLQKNSISTLFNSNFVYRKQMFKMSSKKVSFELKKKKKKKKVFFEKKSLFSLKKGDDERVKKVVEK